MPQLVCRRRFWWRLLAAIVVIGVLSRMAQTGLSLFDKYLGDALYAAVYDIPQYQRYTLGSRADLQAATLQEIADFFKVFYAPNNAVLSIAGDFDPAEARRRVEHYFEHIPAQPPAPALTLTQAVQTEERRVEPVLLGGRAGPPP